MMHFTPPEVSTAEESGYTSLHRALVFARTNKAIVTAIRTVQSIMTWVEERDRYPRSLDELSRIGGRGQVRQVAEGKGNVHDRVVQRGVWFEKSRNEPGEGEALHDVARKGGQRVADGDRSNENKQQHRHEFEDLCEGQGEPEGCKNGKHDKGRNGVDEFRKGDPYHVDEPAGGGVTIISCRLKSFFKWERSEDRLIPAENMAMMNPPSIATPKRLPRLTNTITRRIERARVTVFRSTDGVVLHLVHRVYENSGEKLALPAPLPVLTCHRCHPRGARKRRCPRALPD